MDFPEILKNVDLLSSIVKLIAFISSSNMPEAVFENIPDCKVRTGKFKIPSDFTANWEEEYTFTKVGVVT